jgi:hypothetical protein
MTTPRCILYSLLMLAGCTERVVVGHEPPFIASNASSGDAGPDAGGATQEDAENEAEMGPEDMQDGEDDDAVDAQMTDGND